MLTNHFAARPIRIMSVFVVAALLLISIGITPVLATTHTVCLAGPPTCDYVSIQAAITPHLQAIPSL
jgi:hypothetical protein